jgi:hypothetical protein
MLPLGSSVGILHGSPRRNTGRLQRLQTIARSSDQLVGGAGIVRSGVRNQVRGPHRQFTRPHRRVDSRQRLQPFREIDRALCLGRLHAERARQVCLASRSCNATYAQVSSIRFATRAFNPSSND